MIKKLLCLILLLNFGFVLATPNQSTNEFPLMLETGDIPSGGGDGNGSSSGLSGGAVTAITLGSIGGVGLLGVGYLIYKKQGLCLNQTFGCKTPLIADNTNKISICDTFIRKKSYDIINFEIPKGKNNIKITQINSDNRFLEMNLYLDKNMDNKINLAEISKDIKNKTKTETAGLNNSKCGTLTVINRFENKRYNLILEFE